MAWNAEQFRDLLRDYLTEPEFAEGCQLIDGDEGEHCLGVTLEDGSRFFVTVVKIGGGPFPHTTED